jgi:hypothetical protein
MYPTPAIGPAAAVGTRQYQLDLDGFEIVDRRPPDASA